MYLISFSLIITDSVIPKQKICYFHFTGQRSCCGLYFPIPAYIRLLGNIKGIKRVNIYIDQQAPYLHQVIQTSHYKIHFTGEKALAVFLLTVRAFYFINLFPRFLYRLHSASLHIMNGIIQFRKKNIHCIIQCIISSLSIFDSSISKRMFDTPFDTLLFFRYEKSP